MKALYNAEVVIPGNVPQTKQFYFSTSEERERFDTMIAARPDLGKRTWLRAIGPETPEDALTELEEIKTAND
jgi:hypothetical protein